MKPLLKTGCIIFIVCFYACSNCKIVGTKKNNTSVIKVMSYNIHHANPPSRPGIIDIKAIADVINTQKPDIVALQEIDVHTNRSGVEVNEAEEIGRLTGMNAYFAKTIDYDGGEYGVAILSKYKMESNSNFPLPTVQETNGEHRTLATATIMLPENKKILFASTHLDAQQNDTNRVLQINKILEILQKETLPVIIAGDLNSVPSSRVIKRLDSHFTRTCINDCPFTIPENAPVRTIDFIAYAPFTSFDVLEHKVINEKYASDHLPVIAVLRIK